MRTGRTVASVIVVLIAGGILSQLPSARGDDSKNPLSALWNAIFDLQSRDDDLQAQIDELRAERNALPAKSEPVFVSDTHSTIRVGTGEDGHMLIHIIASNSGPDRATGVKLTAFYLMPLFEINSINGDQCEDKSRGIIECIIGTLEAGQESVVTIDAAARESGQENTWTVDISTTTDDANYTNNHVAYAFETGSGKTVETRDKQDDGAQDDASKASGAEPEQGRESGSEDTMPAESQSIANQTTTENESNETSSGNQTSKGTEQASSEHGSNAAEEQGSEGYSSEPSDDQTEEQQSNDSATGESGNGDSEKGTNDNSGKESGSDGSGSEDGEENFQ